MTTLRASTPTAVEKHAALVDRNPFDGEPSRLTKRTLLHYLKARMSVSPEDDTKYSATPHSKAQQLRLSEKTNPSKTPRLLDCSRKKKKKGA
jgi:hypothetical protein